MDGLGVAALPDAAGAERGTVTDCDAVGDGVPDGVPEEDGEGTPVQAAVASIAAVTASVVAVLGKVLV